MTERLIVVYLTTPVSWPDGPFSLFLPKRIDLLTSPRYTVDSYLLVLANTRGAITDMAGNEGMLKVAEVDQGEEG